MLGEDDDWRSEMLDDEGNYIQERSAYDLPATVNRGTAPQRLNMQHGFMKHIEHNQMARQNYETQNPSDRMQQRYLESREPKIWRRRPEELSATEAERYRAGLDDSNRYVPPHMREDSGSGVSTQSGSLDRGPQCKHASSQGHTAQHLPSPQKAKADSPSLPPGMPSLARHSAVQSNSNTGSEPAHRQTSLDTAAHAAASDHSDSRQLVVPRSDVLLTMPDMASGSSADQDNDVTLHADSAAANEEGKRQRKFREGFGAYTAPPVLGKLQRASEPALVTGAQTKASAGGRSPLSANQALAPPASAQQQAPLRAVTALPQTRSSLPANGVSSAMPNMGEHLQASSPASHVAGPSSSASYSRELAGTVPQQQLEQAASRPSTVSQTRPQARGSQFAVEPSSTAPPPGIKPASTVQTQGSAAVPAVSSPAAVADHTPPGFGSRHTPTDQSQHSLTPAASSIRANAPPGVRQDPPPASQTLPYSTHPASSGTDHYPPGFTHPSAPMTQAQPSNAGDVAAVMRANSSVQHPRTQPRGSRTHSLSSSEPANSFQPCIVLPIPISAKTPRSSVRRSSQAGAAAHSPDASGSTSRTSHDLPPGFASSTKAAVSQMAADVPPGFAQSQSLPPRRAQSQSLAPASSSRAQMAAAASAEKSAAGKSGQGVSDLPSGFKPISRLGSSDFNSQGNSSRQNTPAALSARHQTTPTPGALQTAPPTKQQWGDESQAPNPAAQEDTATQVVGLASHRMPLSRPNLASSPSSHNAPKFASSFLVPDRGHPRSQSRPTSSRSAANAASDLPPGFASLAIGQAPNQVPAGSDLPPGFASLARSQAPNEAPNGMGRPAERASSSTLTGDALSWAVAEQLVLPVLQKPVVTIIPVAAVAEAPWIDPGETMKRTGVQPSASKSRREDLDDLPPGFAPGPQQPAEATAALPSSAKQPPGSTAVLQGAAAVGRGLSRHSQPAQEAPQQRRQQDTSMVAELPPGFETPAKQEYPTNQGPGRRPPAEQTHSAAVDLPPGFTPFPANGLPIGRPSQPRSQLPSDLPPGFGAPPGNGLPMPTPSQQPAQRADLSSGSDVVLRPYPSPAMQSGTRSSRKGCSQANGRQAVSSQEDCSQANSGLASSSQAESSQAASDQLKSRQAPQAATQAAPQAAGRAVVSSQAVASQHPNLPPGFSAPFGQHTLQSAALQSTAARPGSHSGALMTEDHWQRQQQAPRSVSPCVSSGSPVWARPNVQDVRQSVSDVPQRPTAVATMLCVAGRDVRQSVYDSAEAAASVRSDTEAASSSRQVSEEISHQPGVHDSHNAGGHDAYHGGSCPASEPALDANSWQGRSGRLGLAYDSDHSESSRSLPSRPASVSQQQQAHNSDNDRSSRSMRSQPASASHQQQTPDTDHSRSSRSMPSEPASASHQQHAPDTDHSRSSRSLHSQLVSSASHQQQARSHPVATSYASQNTGDGWDVNSPVMHGLDRSRLSNDGPLTLGDASQSAYTAEDYAWAQGEPEASLTSQLTSQQQQHPWATALHDTASSWDQAGPHPVPDQHQHATHRSRQQSSQLSHLPSHQVRQRSSQQHGPSSAQGLPGQPSSQPSYLSSHQVRQPSSQQHGQRLPHSQAGRPPAYAQVKQGYRHRPEAHSDFQLQQGSFPSRHTSEAGALEEESGAASAGMAHQPPRKLSEVIGLMSWVMPKPTPSEKLESVGWEGEGRTGPPWKQLRALNKSEKRGYGWSTDQEPDPSRAVFSHSAGQDSEVQLWRRGRTSFMFRKSDPTRPGPLAATWD